MLLFDLAALTAALCVAISNLISPSAIRHFGPIVFNCWRLSAALGALAVLATVRGSWTTFSFPDLVALVVSSLIGIVIGDSAVYAAMFRLGPRRTALLYATNAPFATLFGFVVLGETLSVAKLSGIALVVVGVCIAIAYRDAASVGFWEEVHGRLSTGIVFGLLGGLGAAAAALIARPVMAGGVDPAAAAVVRSAAGLLGLGVLSRVPGFRGHNPASTRIVTIAALSGLLGMGAGMTLVLFALSMRPTGIVTTLASTTPVLLLPLLWLVSGKRPAPQAWLGAVLAVTGVGVLSSSL